MARAMRAALAAGGRGAGGGRLRQRARHRHAAERPHRGAGDLAQVFGEGRVLVSSTKSMIGHTMAAAGSLEAVATMLALVARSASRRPRTSSRPIPRSRFDCVPARRARGGRRVRDLQLVRLRRAERHPAVPARVMTATRRERRHHRRRRGQRGHRRRVPRARCVAGPAAPRAADRRVPCRPCACRRRRWPRSIDAGEARRLSRVCQLTIAAARLAVAEAGLDPRGTGARASSDRRHRAGRLHLDDRVRRRLPGPRAGRTVAAAVPQHRDEHDGRDHRDRRRSARAVPHAQRSDGGRRAGGRARGRRRSRAGASSAVLAGGVDELDPLVGEMLRGARRRGVRGEGATFLVLEDESRGARVAARAVLGRIGGAAWRSLPARPWGVGRQASLAGDRPRRSSAAGGRRPELALRLGQR